MEMSKAELNKIIKAGRQTIASIKPTGTDHEVKIKGIKGLTIRVTKSGFKTFYLYYTIKGKKRKYKLGKTEDISLATAIKLVENVRARIALGEDPAKQRTEERRNNKKQKADKFKVYLEGVYLPYIKSERTKHKSAKRTEYILNHNFKHLMNKNIANITTTDIEAWIDGELERGISNSTINRALTSIKACLNHAVSEKLINENPCKGIKRLPVSSRGVVRYLSTDEEVRLYKALEARSGYFPVFIKLLLHTGCRPNELKTLKWSAVNLKLKLITIHAAYSKQDKTRHIPLNNTIFAVLQTWHTETHECEAPSPYVFTNPLTGRRIVSVQKPWRNLLKDADIQNFRLYDCRHTFASKLAMKGVEIYRISELLGHSSVEMTKVYAHLSPDYLADAVNAIG